LCFLLLLELVGNRRTFFPPSMTNIANFKYTLLFTWLTCSLLCVCVALDNGLARTPPMGYDTWNAYHCNYDAATLMGTAKAMKEAGMLELGYEYIYPDDCWLAPERTADGKLQPNPYKFPYGLKPVIDYIHSLGFKFGIYNCAGTRTCAGFPGCYGHYDECAQQFAEWGVDYIKFDWCNVPFADYPGLNHKEVAKILYSEFRDALNRTGRPIVFSMCNGWDPDVRPWEWASDVSNLWRTTMDIADNYDVMRDRYEQNILHGDKAGPGHWNNPDMLEVGNGGMTTTEYITHFSLWSIMAAPLVIGTNVINMSETTKHILTNKEVIDVNQDSLGIQGFRVKHDIAQDVITKPLSNGDVAVVLFSANGGGVINTTIDEVFMDPSYPAYVLRDLWSHNETTVLKKIAAYVDAHAVAMYRIRPGKPSDAPPHHVIYWDSNPALVSYAEKNFTGGLRIENLGASDMLDVQVDLEAPSDVEVMPLTKTKFPIIHMDSEEVVAWNFKLPNNTSPGSKSITAVVSFTYPYSSSRERISHSYGSSLTVPDLEALGKDGVCSCSSS